VRDLDFRVSIEPQQGASYAEQLAVARAAEELGFSALFRSDHYVAMTGDGLPGPTDSWVTLAGLARETSTIRLGTMVTSATFRHPGPLAVAVAQVDAMSGGRVDFGLGAGWFEAEHLAYAIPFPSLRERFERLAEQLDIITGMWSTSVGEKFDYTGAHYTIQRSPALPKPVQQRVPIVIGGHGVKRTPALAAKFASEFNIAHSTLDTVKAQFDRVRTAVVAAGREPDSMTYSVLHPVCTGRSDREVSRRSGGLGPELGALHPLVGTPGQLVDTLGAFVEAGVQRVYVQMVDLADLDNLAVLADEVFPQFR
jgi:F420-dependent oxidoreductase-like protein